MEARASEDIGMGEDITPPLLPLSYALHHPFLHSHCSSCLSPLPNSPFPPILPYTSSSPTLLYCSSLCSSSDSPLHFSSAEFHLFLSSTSPPPSDLRTALRLLHSLPSLSHCHGRISGFLTNRDKLISDHEIFAPVRDGARAMASARRLRYENENENENDAVLLEEMEAALCLIITNAVEVQDNEGRALGIALYDTAFSWINHSCSANACYRFLVSTPGAQTSFSVDSRLRMFPGGGNGEKSLYNNLHLFKGRGEYGPRIIVRSIKSIKRNEEVTVAYTDLLQPKAIRQSELWSKYRFICCCARCSALPSSFVDHIWQEVTASNLASSSLSADHSFCRDDAARKLTDYIEGVIAKYLSVDDVESCCEKLENILTLGLLDESSETMEGKPQLNVRLHPFHYLSLNACMTLASAYRIRGSDLLALNSEVVEHQLECFDMFRRAAAYSFLLASATYHLFCFESSLIASVANFSTGAGESLIALARSPVWNLFRKCDLPGSELFSFGKHKCLLIDRFEANSSLSKDQNEDFKKISSEFLDCISSLSRKVWSSLAQGCHYLKMFVDPTNFTSLGELWSTSVVVTNLVRTHMDSCCWSEERTAQKFTYEERANVFKLGVHCLLYGELLASLCYGKNPNSTSNIRSLSYYEEK